MEIKVEKVKDVKGINIKCDDGTPLKSALNALREFESRTEANKTYVAEAFNNKTVAITIKAYGRWMPMGKVSLSTFIQYKDLINLL